MKSLMKNRIFLIMLSSDLLDQLSIWIRNMAILFFVIEKTNQNPIAVSLITVIEYIPLFLFSFIGGTLADR
ncbi:MFS transporter [Bacillus sp. AP8]|uniref:MFS transporter n=2 Tax=Bacillus TaxID=1386 RepID=UPI0002FAABFE